MTPAPLIPPTLTRSALAFALFVAVADTVREPAVRSALAPRYALVAPLAFASGRTTEIAPRPTVTLLVVEVARESRSTAVIVAAPVTVSLPSMEAEVDALAPAVVSTPAPATPPTATVMAVE